MDHRHTNSVVELNKLFKIKTHPIIFQEKFLNIQNNFPDHYRINTVGSKQGMKVGCAAIFQNQTNSLKKFPDKQLKVPLKKKKPEDILSFLKETNLFIKSNQT